MSSSTPMASMVQPESSAKEYLKFAAVIVVIVITSLVLKNIEGKFTLISWLRWFMGVFFFVFAAFKFVGYKMFALMFSGYDLIAKKFKPYAYAYPFIELALAILYLGNFIPTTRDIITLIIMTIGAIGVTIEVKKRSGIHCACLGNVIKLPLSTTSLVEDTGMGLMALVMLIWR